MHLDDLIILSKFSTAGFCDTYVNLVFVVNAGCLINLAKSDLTPKEV